MRLCIAEKPSVARDIAKVLGANIQKNGYLEGNGYWVTWTFGHLCTLKEPHDYSPSLKSWNLFSLPIIPKNFGVKLIPNKGVENQFNIIKNLVEQCQEVINCGDAGQEGELIQRWVLQKAQCQKPVKRLWISSLTEEAIREGFENLKPEEEYFNLYQAGNARAIGDWLLGINATRLFTKKFSAGQKVLSIGRVQTPTLAMIVQRQKEIDAFKSAEYWELKTLYKEVIFQADIPRLNKEEKAQKGLEYLKKFPFEITQIETKEGVEKNPRLFDLTSLQVEANKKFGYSAEETLSYIQSLYEKKHTSYPRVDTTYLSEAVYPKIRGILQSMKHYQKWTLSILNQEKIPKPKAVFDDTKITDHHAIIPTEIPPTEHLTTQEKHIYDLVARRFIAVFYPVAKVSSTIVEGKVGEIFFKTQGKQILEMGWQMIYAKDIKKNKENENQEAVLPAFEIGEKGEHQPLIHKGKTSPPKPYTEATLLRAMETAGKQVDDEELREVMKSKGIGRPSTRANIIETLIKRNYIEKKRKNILPTPMGMELIDIIDDELLKSPELTGEWEFKLRKMEQGAYQISDFKEELIQMIKNLTQKIINEKIKSDSVLAQNFSKDKKSSEQILEKRNNIEDLKCPKCQSKTIVKGKTAYGCENYKECGFKIPLIIFEKKITEKQIFDLIKKGKTTKIKGFKNQEKTQGNLILNASFQVELI